MNNSCQNLTESEELQKSGTDVLPDQREHFTCEFCQLPFVLKTRYEKHKKLHVEPKPFTCIHCEEAFAHVTDLQDHRDKEHMCNKTFKCPDCPKTFSSRMALSEHAWRHTGEKLHECDVCKKRYSSKGNLKIHAEKHLEIKKHKCGSCSRRFVSYSSLERHVARHSGFRPYKCRFCASIFSQVFQLKDHERTHKGERSFNCSFCKKGFYSNSALLNHKKLHTMAQKVPGELNRRQRESDRLTVVVVPPNNRKRIVCPFCKKSLNATCNLAKHLLRHKELNFNVTKAKAFAKLLKPLYIIEDAPENSDLCKENEDAGANHESMLTSMSTEQSHCPGFRRNDVLQKPTRKQSQKCQFCSQAFHVHKRLRRHIVLEHPMEAALMGISKQVTFNSEHIAMENQSNTCFKGSSKKSEPVMNENRKSSASNGKRRFICKSRMASYYESKPFKCWLCPEIFRSPADVVIHMTNDHDSRQIHLSSQSTEVDVSKNDSSCWASNHSQSNGQHDAPIMNVKEYRCSKCNKSFTSQAVFSMHEIAHNILAIDSENSTLLDSTEPRAHKTTPLDSSENVLEPLKQSLGSSKAALHQSIPPFSSPDLPLDKSRLPSDSSYGPRNSSGRRLHSSGASFESPKSLSDASTQPSSSYEGSLKVPRETSIDRTLSSIMSAVEALSKGSEVKPRRIDTPILQVTNVRSLRCDINKHCEPKSATKGLSDKLHSSFKLGSNETVDMANIDDVREANESLPNSGISSETSFSISQLSRLCENLVPDYLPISRVPSELVSVPKRESLFDINSKPVSKTITASLNDQSILAKKEPMKRSATWSQQRRHQCQIFNGFQTSTITQKNPKDTHSTGSNSIPLFKSSNPFVGSFGFSLQEKNKTKNGRISSNIQPVSHQVSDACGVKLLEITSTSSPIHSSSSDITTSSESTVSQKEMSKKNLVIYFDNQMRLQQNENQKPSLIAQPSVELREDSYAVRNSGLCNDETRQKKDPSEGIHSSLPCQVFFNNEIRMLEKAIGRIETDTMQGGTRSTSSITSPRMFSSGCDKTVNGETLHANGASTDSIRNDLSLNSNPRVSAPEQSFTVQGKMLQVSEGSCPMNHKETAQNFCPSQLKLASTETDLSTFNGADHGLALHVPPVVKTTKKPPEGFKIGYTLAYVPVLVPENKGRRRDFEWMKKTKNTSNDRRKNRKTNWMFVKK